MLGKRNRAPGEARLGSVRVRDWLHIPAVLLTAVVCFFLGVRYGSSFHRHPAATLSHGSLPLASANSQLHAAILPKAADQAVDLIAKYGPADESLKALLDKIAVNGEVIAAVSNSALISSDGKSGMLKTWIDSLQRLNVKNYFVIAIDDTLASILEKQNVPYWRKDARATADASLSNHGISARKFQLVKEVLKLGYSLMLSDVDIVVLQNPFEHLVRDEDVEGLSDGFDEGTAYMYNDVFDDPKMGWSRYAHTMRIFVLNSGLFYLRPNERTIDLMDRITARLTKEKAWDQAVFNEEIFFPSSPKNKASHVSVRVMDIYKFVNSKTLFRTMRYEGRFKDHMPVMVHVNYHPDKWTRMQAVWRRYIEKDVHALDSFPLGVGATR